MPTYRVITLGCKVNHYESRQVEELLEARGYVPARDGNSDLTVINTCSVTASAAGKSRNLIRRSARKGQQTIAIGCYATSHTAEARQILPSGCVLTHQDDLATELGHLLSADHPGTADRRSKLGTLSLPQLTHHQPLTQRAILKIQDGCDAHCTYCIIPKLRPVLWSRPADQAIAEARNLVMAGHHEIVLTGVFLGAYGQTTALHRRQAETGRHLADVVRRLCTEVPGLLRLRLSSLEPGDVTPVLVEALATHPQVMPHFHLPLQSGSDAILRRMNRQYTATDYMTMIHRLRQAFDRPAFTADIIVGFPGESEDDFHATLDAAESAEFLHIHAFPFSPREGTAAARWQKQMVTQRLVTERMKAIEDLSSRLSIAYRQQFVGQQAEILVEHADQSVGRPISGPAASAGAPIARETRANPVPLVSLGPVAPPATTASPTASVPASVSPESGNPRMGRSERYFAIHFSTSQDLTSQLVRVHIDTVTPTHTLGHLV